MPRRSWKKVQANNLNQAMELCLEYARDKNNRSVESVAALMGVNHWTLYKWLESSGMPVRLVKSFEHACGIDFVSRCLAMGSNKVVIEVPTGRQCDSDDLFALQESTNDAVGALLQFYTKKASIEDTLTAVQKALEGLTWHKGNVEKASQPDIPFEMEKS